MFHHLLKIMAVYDFVVVVGCGLLYSLPKLPVFSPYSQVIQSFLWPQSELIKPVYPQATH